MSKGKSGRSAQYSDAEIDVLLNLVERFKPMGMENWEKVGLEFRDKFRENNSVNRDTESLR